MQLKMYFLSEKSTSAVFALNFQHPATTAALLTPAGPGQGDPMPFPESL